MGETAELMLAGVLCTYCGIVNENIIGEGDIIADENIPNHPWTCEDCKKEKLK